VSGIQEDNLSQNQRPDDIANVLIVDDDCETARLVLGILARKGIRGHLAKDEKTALDFLDKASFDLVFAAEQVPKRADHSGADKTTATASTLSSSARSRPSLIRHIRENSPELPVIMMGQALPAKSANTRKTVRRPPEKRQQKPLRQKILSAVQAIHQGCCDFLPKPLEHDEIDRLLDTFLPNHNVSTLAAVQQNSHYLYRIVGRSAKLMQTVDLAKRIAPTSAPVLIGGESGTGKELVSYLVHHKSKRAQGPYVKVNCAALSDSLLESELFGHEKGAFTGAYNQRRGRFEIAHGGTLLLDEITETPPRFQAKLLRVLEQQDFERVGGNENVRVDVRIVSTTNKDLQQEVRQGRFRRDLYYRLSGIRIAIAPLRERTEDVPDLIWHFVNLYAILGTGDTLSLADVSWLLDETPLCNNLAPWQSARLQRSGEIADGQDIAGAGIERSNVESCSLSDNRGLGGVPLEQIERRAILDTLSQTAGNQTRAAKVLGISDRTLRDKIRRYRQQGSLQPTPK
jgi:DNA-binding NtrC family response regulator